MREIMELKHFLTIDIGGKPIAQGRPKFSTRNGYPRAYDPKKSSDYKALMRMVAVGEMSSRGLKPTDEPLLVRVMVRRLPPRNWSKRKLVSLDCGEWIPVTVKPDLDNYVKALDGLNGIVWTDDNRICRIEAEKFYSTSEGMTIEVYEVTP